MSLVSSETNLLLDLEKRRASHSSFLLEMLSRNIIYITYCGTIKRRIKLNSKAHKLVDLITSRCLYVQL